MRSNVKWFYGSSNQQQLNAALFIRLIVLSNIKHIALRGVTFY